MRRVQHLCRHGSSSSVVIPRPFMDRLNWITGMDIMIELGADLQSVIVRKPKPEDFGISLSPQALAAEPVGPR
jgi:antitoxin component of MazEF toxin-antitoxin module